MKTKFARAVLVATLLTLAAAPSRAQSVEADVPDTTGRGALYVRGSYGHRFDADLKDAPSGQFSSDDARLELGGSIDFGSVRWVNAFGYGYGHYDVDLERANVDLKANIHSFMLASLVDIDVAKSCNLMVGPVVTQAAEEHADWGEALSYGALIGSVYRPSKELSVGLSLVAMKRIEEGVGITPIPMVNWRFARRWQLYTGITEVGARRGIGGYVGWSFAKNWEAAVGVQFERRRFRLDAADAIGEDKAAPVYARISWEIIRGLTLDATAGAAFAGRVKINDSKDHFKAGSEYDPAPVVGVRLRYAVSGI